MSKGPVSTFIEHHYRHFNAAALMDAAKGYEKHLHEGGKGETQQSDGPGTASERRGGGIGVPGVRISG